MGRTRARTKGTAERPRLSVFRSNTYTAAQLIDDATGKTLAAATSRGTKGTKTKAAAAIGALIAAAAKKGGIIKVVFDRGRYAYHGRVKALAEAARKAGLDF